MAADIAAFREGTSTGKCGQIGAAPTKSGLPLALIDRCKGLILRHNSRERCFSADLLQGCISPSRLCRRKHAETAQIGGSRAGARLREWPSLAARL
ncbi:hypothetical protein C7U92_02355 [Bradyrhizobium sp. WBOS7]|uniref:Uncharacterized protein n=1 Tax=Bradyrhizobium betae TaxID=244734 RepID=A0AAE9ND87_9BRAD|nr:hypothetical protein [Bradyrhizobium sp. WBOS2]MDD1569478.1 hypothetical protein [Bradyrhizobium sp. WBOS1]MDD1575577.1 hypothetical protein [Bradyrhizobium sp. WBOS7]MDD1604261.1 hypothetical protein [Bradyrhizobium sp. WBOS16]UUO36015.1 hypothetical protein DCK84_16555 [Bradyrhizobium sp. WBOS01]UUO42321.1 hypothetical protein DCM75_17310 [Bradyrhizobium sp. WBOS02]UUO56660.1 hypothetical protein DCM79_29100 [Bradyrhizobium sp. WBOS07]UUO66654.1 hypothetical protein DCM83_16565 [Bradyrh